MGWPVCCGVRYSSFCIVLFFRLQQCTSDRNMHACRRFLSACGIYGLVSLLELDQSECMRVDGRMVLDSIILCFLIFSAVSLLSKLGCRMLSMRVTGSTLFDKLRVRRSVVTANPTISALVGSVFPEFHRINVAIISGLLQATVDQEQVLSQLMAPPEAAEMDAGSQRVQMLAKMRDIPPAAVGAYLMDLHRASLSAPYKIHESFAEQLTRLTKSVRCRPACLGCAPEI